jgi:hypothetical protein
MRRSSKSPIMKFNTAAIALYLCRLSSGYLPLTHLVYRRLQERDCESSASGHAPQPSIVQNKVPPPFCERNRAYSVEP